MHTLIGRAARPAVRTILASFFVAGTAAAQDTALVMVHGINSNETTWSFAASQLQWQLRVVPVLPGLNWLRSEPEQASQLASILDGDGHTSNPARRMPFVGHSNGGLVSREYSRSGGRLSHAVTVGTPHRGAFLANAFLAGYVTDYAAYLINSVYDPLDFYATQDPATPGILQAANVVGSYLVSWADAILYNMCPAYGMCWLNYIGGTLAPVAFALAENSTATQTLNTESNLTREANDILGRVGLWTALDPENAVFHVLTPESANEWSAVRFAAMGAYFYAYDHYRYHEDWVLRYYADLWLWGVVALVDMDADWQELTGNLLHYYSEIDTYHGYVYTFMTVRWNDGIVPYTSAEYPGGISQQVVGNIAHGRQTSSAFVVDKVREVLVNFGIPPREYQPPPPSNSVSIHGPYAMRPGNSCYWNASTDIASATFEWSVNGSVVAYGSDLLYTAYSDFTLSVRGYNAEGVNATAARSISVNSGNGDCPL
jgi:pimeloyl-ACP methyl ester carboxylesterase